MKRKGWKWFRTVTVIVPMRIANKMGLHIPNMMAARGISGKYHCLVMDDQRVRIRCRIFGTVYEIDQLKTAIVAEAIRLSKEGKSAE